ncbi:MAG: protoporphyrinogen oxidase, partial [Acidiferrobacterales bacterium]|nr:protoporphyrinogen oxidase [Acidiferrobacterales bacterium]
MRRLFRFVMGEIIVIGAGISGLATAWFLKVRGYPVRVLESTAEPGGCARTIAERGFLVDAGPTSTLYRNGALGELITSLGLGEEVVEANAVARNRYIVKDGELLTLPLGPFAFARTPLFSAKAKVRLLLEPFHGRARDEESVAQFVARRLGPEILDWAIDPFVSGVYAGDPTRLSARAATAKVYALEAEYGSLFIGAIRRLLRRRASGPQPRGKLISFRNGMQSLATAIASKLDGHISFNTEVSALARTANEEWIVRAGEREFRARRVVLATPAYCAAKLLAPLDADLGAALERIPYPPVASVALGFSRGQVRHPLNGFGMLIPSKVGRVTLGALFSSTLFPGRAPDGEVLLTAFVGGARNRSVATLTQEELIARILSDLRPLLGIDGDAH